MKKLSDIATERRLRYLGHIERYPEDRWVKKTLTLVQEKKRGPGRPKNTWKREVEADMRERGLELADAHDKEKWKTAIGKAPVKTPTQNKRPPTQNQLDISAQSGGIKP